MPLRENLVHHTLIKWLTQRCIHSVTAGKGVIFDEMFPNHRLASGSHKKGTSTSKGTEIDRHNEKPGAKYRKGTNLFDLALDFEFTILLDRPVE